MKQDQSLFRQIVLVLGGVWLLVYMLILLDRQESSKRAGILIVNERGCDYLQLNGRYGNPVAIIEVADQPSTCKYNIFKLSEIKKR